MLDLEKITLNVREIALRAGAFLRNERSGFDRSKVEKKNAHDYVSYVDKESERRIVAQLRELLPEAGFIAEEGSGSLTTENYCWLVDPLDGTKEFIKRNGEFTVNIALIDHGKPILGVVYAPVMNVMYSAAEGKAWKEECGVRKQIQVRDARPPLVVISRSHADAELKEYLQQLGEHQTTSIGSSLKFCLVAEGQAQLYPRFGPTNIWDTAAGHAVAAAAGAHVHDWQGKPLDYTPRESFLNPGFRVSIY